MWKVFFDWPVIRIPNYYAGRRSPYWSEDNAFPCYRASGLRAEHLDHMTGWRYGWLSAINEQLLAATCSAAKLINTPNIVCRLRFQRRGDDGRQKCKRGRRSLRDWDMTEGKSSGDLVAPKGQNPRDFGLSVERWEGGRERKLDARFGGVVYIRAVGVSFKAVIRMNSGPVKGAGRHRRYDR